MSEYCKNCYELQEQLDRLKSENEKLKNKIKELLHDCNSSNFHKYKQTLIEIKEIAEKIENFAERIDEGNWGILDWKIIDKSRTILQKISKCEV